MQETIRWRAVVKYAGAFVAYMIGSGFASGQEILQFFTSYGLWGVGGAAISLALFCWSGSALMQQGFVSRQDPQFNGYHYYCGKVLGRVFDWCVPVFLFGMVVVMFCGAGATVQQYFGLPQWIGSGGMALLVALSVMLGLQRLIDIIGCLGPITILFTLIIAVGALCSGHGNLAAGAQTSNALLLPRPAGTWWMAGLLYVAYNTAGAVPFLTAMGTGAISRREARFGAVTGSVALMLCAMLISLAMLANIWEVSGLNIPILYLASLLSPVFGLLFSLILLGEIFSTAAPMLWIASTRLAPEGTALNKLAVVLLTILAFFCGQLPFATLVGIIYPYTGYAGIALLCAIACKAIWLRRGQSAPPPLRTKQNRPPA